MPVCPEKRYATTQAMPMYNPGSAPNSSMPINVHAIGVLVAPENTATNPTAAKRLIGNGIMAANALPKVAPTKNNGVTSPPLKPTPMVNVVNISFSAKSYHICWVVNDSTMTGTPRPMYLVVPNAHTAKAMTIPPTTGRSGG